MPLPLTLGPSRALLAVPPTAAFTPASLSGLVLWLRADSGLYQDSAGTTPATVDGDPVGKWTDLSGTGNHVVQTTAGKRPTLKLAIQNGRPVLRFDGVDDFLLCAVPTASAGLQAATGCSLVAAARFSTVGTATQKALCQICTNAANTTRMALWAERTAANKLETGGRRLDADAFVGTFGAVADTSWHVHSGVNDCAAALSTIYQDGTQQTQTNPFQTAGTMSNTASTGLSVGGTTSGSGLHPGDIAELLVCNVPLSAANRQAVEAYLKARYGTP